MALPASGPGRLLERRGDAAPRRMAVHDRTRLIGRLRRFFSRVALKKAPNFCAANVWGPGSLPPKSPRRRRALFTKGGFAPDVVCELFPTVPACALLLALAVSWACLLLPRRSQLIWPPLWLGCCGRDFSPDCRRLVRQLALLARMPHAALCRFRCALQFGDHGAKKAEMLRFCLRSYRVPSPESPVPSPSSLVSPRNTPSAPKRRSWIQPRPSPSTATMVLARVP
ncbi:hypothetical protein XTPLMG730_3525 [Xanthomonas translucens pv. phlei]|uniref:Uncharacterized protein n=1 Tax=Xanthomonas graminis pv. phlei TaxID=487906 RepID=A0A0K3A5J6_9XANT|nr:hypothetical protein XTPLMG730_3525 [Xanthomonas translucens pv. phlei]